MTELTVNDTGHETCPPWCVSDGNGDEDHTHASDELRVETMAQPLAVQLVQVAGTAPRLLVDGQVASLEQAHAFASGIRRLTDAATLAEPGLGFVLRLAGSSITLEEMALASGIDVARLRRQRAGGRLLTVAEIDRLALAVANLAAAGAGVQRQNTR